MQPLIAQSVIHAGLWDAGRRVVCENHAAALFLAKSVECWGGLVESF